MTEAYTNIHSKRRCEINDESNEEVPDERVKCSSMVVFPNDNSDISSVHNVDGDCIFGMGDICYDGSIHVFGSVRSGSTIKATGCIIVEGNVEAAKVIAGGSVVVRGGMQGAEKGLIEAGGSVDIDYVECGTIIADGPVTMDSCIHSVVESEETVTAKGRRGAIIGGRVSSAGDITANFIGAISNSHTEVASGVMPRKMARLNFIDIEIRSILAALKQLDHLDSCIKDAQNSMNSEIFNRMQKSNNESRTDKNKMLNIYYLEKEKLEYEMTNKEPGMVHVLGTIFSGSAVYIGTDNYTVHENIHSVSFIKKTERVICVPCIAPRIQLLKGVY